MHTDKTQKEICQLVGWTEKTFVDHKKKKNWATLKSAMSITPSQIIAKLYEKMSNLSEEEDIDADKLIKVANSIEKLQNKKITVSQSINVFKDFTGWLFGHDQELAKQVNQAQKRYIDQMISNE